MSPAEYDLPKSKSLADVAVEAAKRVESKSHPQQRSRPFGKLNPPDEKKDLAKRRPVDVPAQVPVQVPVQERRAEPVLINDRKRKHQHAQRAIVENIHELTEAIIDDLVVETVGELNHLEAKSKADLEAQTAEQIVDQAQRAVDAFEKDLRRLVRQWGDPQQIEQEDRLDAGEDAMEEMLFHRLGHQLPADDRSPHNASLPFVSDDDESGHMISHDMPLQPVNRDHLDVDRLILDLEQRLHRLGTRRSEERPHAFLPPHSSTNAASQHYRQLFEKIAFEALRSREQFAK